MRFLSGVERGALPTRSLFVGLLLAVACLAGYLVSDAGSGGGGLGAAGTTLLRASSLVGGLGPRQPRISFKSEEEDAAEGDEGEVAGELNVRAPRNFITFIIPTKGRRSLNSTLASLVNQTLPHSWRAIVVIDGKPDTRIIGDLFADPRIRNLALEKRLGTPPAHAGAARNIGAKLARTPWLAWVDDDEALHPQAVERLLFELQGVAANGSAGAAPPEVVVFRWWRGENPAAREVLPPPGEKRMHAGLPISFAVRRLTFLEGFKFVVYRDGGGEWLEAVQNARKPILLSPFVSWMANGTAFPEPLPDQWKALNRELIA